MSSKQPLDVRFRFLIDKITTSGKYEPDTALVSELCGLCCGDQFIHRIFFNILIVQLQKPHSEIRLGVVRLLALLTNQDKFISTLQSSSVKGFTTFDMKVAIRNIRELALRNLQTIIALVLRTDATDRPLPLPQAAVQRMREEFLNLLLDWERDMKPMDSRRITPCPKTTCTDHARRQLETYLRFLRTGDEVKERFNAELFQAIRDLRLIQEERAYKLRRSRRIRPLIRARVEREFDSYVDGVTSLGERIEENVQSLTSLLEMIVPDPMAEITAETPIDDGSKSDVSSYTDSLRLHGCLPGTSSGLAGASTVEFTLPTTRSSVKTADPVPVIRVLRTKGSLILEESARERARVARGPHYSLITAFIQKLQHKDMAILNGHRRERAAYELKRLLQWRDRVDRLVHLFYDRLVFLDEDAFIAQQGATSSGSGDEQSKSDATVADASDCCDDSDSDNFEDVPCAAVGVESTDDRAVPKEDCVDLYSLSGSDEIGLDSSASQQSSPKPSTGATVEFPDKSTVIWRAAESAHRFWQPIDTEEYVVPQDYMGSAISMSLDGNSLKTDTEVCSSQVAPVAVCSTKQAGEVTEARGGPEGDRRLMACWAPLPSGRRCQQRNPSGVCRIHGRVVPREQVSGRPANPEDRERLRQEQAAARLAKEAARLAARKREARLRHPGLSNLSRRSNSLRSRLVSTRRRTC